jgi:hypothetical protein
VGPIDFIVVDLGSGHSWLSTRLFLFTALLRRLRGLRAIVFVHSRQGASRIFLGVSTPVEVERALAEAYPWMAEAWTWAFWEQIPVTESEVIGVDGQPGQLKDRLKPVNMFETYLSEALAGPSGSFLASKIGQVFLSRVQISTDEDEEEDIEVDVDWQTLPHKSGRVPTQEHARWLTTDDFTDGSLKRALHPEACVVDQAGWRDADRTRAILQITADYVALLAAYPFGRFSQLIERAVLTEKIAVAILDRDT